MARTQGSKAEITGPLVRDAARRLFARHGYAAVSMRQIAAEVGVQVGTLYSYTADKQTLLADLLRRFAPPGITVRAGESVRGSYPQKSGRGAASAAASPP